MDAADLLIDFATLGEYGMEPVERTVEKSCESRHRGNPARHGTRHRGGDRGRDVAARAR